MIFIPVYNPNNEIIKIVIKLIKIYKFKSSEIFIINDNSDEGYEKFFSNLEKIGCVIKKNKGVRGKGSAIKYAINLAIVNKFEFILIADGDGQHLPEDILQIYKIGKKEQNFIIGERNFSNAPYINKLSNYFSTYLFNKITNQNLIDTQCGLRFIHKKHFKYLNNLKETKFDYELVMLFELNKLKFKIINVKINTVYFKQKYNSKFNKIFDTIYIIKVFLIYRFFKNKFTEVTNQNRGDG
tara:strand:- start:2748 stop:3467 length:720 start_codon:yes stop_codon:yes gene_type:complete